jgi:hypothetical protein
MAAVTIPRTAWIDDDGTGTTGTVLNNAVKTELYNQIDTALAGVDAAATPPPWVPIAYNAANFTANVGSWTVTAGMQNLFIYRLWGKSLSIKFSVINATVSGSPAELRIALPTGISILLGNQYCPFNYFDGAAHGIGAINVTAGATFLRLQREAYGVATWPAASASASFVGQIEVALN